MLSHLALVLFAVAPGDLAMLQELGSKERAKLIASMPKEEVAKALSEIPADALLSMGRKELPALGVYSLRLTKEERVDGKWIGPQVMEIEVRETPLAIRGEVVKGPAKGRRLLYNAKLRAKQLRVKEAGLLGMAGAVWLDLDSSLARRDTRHPITDLCFGALLDLLEGDFKKAKAAGGHKRTDLGFVGPDGSYCIKFVAPSGVSGLYAQEAKLCLDPAKGLIASVDVSDGKGLLEKLRYELLKSSLSLGDDDFTPEATKL